MNMKIYHEERKEHEVSEQRGLCVLRGEKQIPDDQGRKA
jgi:hypothetical protein